MILSFPSPAEFRKWLAANHNSSDGIWIRIFKKGSGKVSINYAEALDEALCFGWIDGQKKPHDEFRGCRNSRGGGRGVDGRRSIPGMRSD